MKLRQVLGVVFLSAATAVGSVWGYNRFVEPRPYVYSNQLDSGRVPSNYAGFFNGVNNTVPEA
ncbi:MAG: serine protease, partial [Chitinophagaceae bacterium]|nr:serine protease [Chitinophagaceae bacterium]